jgi:cytochrome b561
MPNNYTRTAVALHWLVGALVILALAMGWIMTDLPSSPLKARVFAWHKWVGVTVLTLFFVRGLWRLTHPVPPPLPMPAWQRLAAQSLHGVLYAMLLLQPLSGWLYSNAAGRQIVYLGLIPLPNLVAKDKLLAKTLQEIHDAGAVIVGIAVGLHILAALKHHFIDRDDTLRRMLRWRAS